MKLKRIQEDKGRIILGHNYRLNVVDPVKIKAEDTVIFPFLNMDTCVGPIIGTSFLL